MSDGRSYAPKKSSSDEERLEDLERKYGVVLERIQTYDKILHEFESIRRNYHSISSGLFETKAKVDESQKELKSLFSSLSSTSTNQKNKISFLDDGIKATLNRIEGVFRHVDEKCGSLAKEFGADSETLRNLLETKVGQTQFDSYAEAQKTFHSNHEKNIQLARDFILDVKNSLLSTADNFTKNFETLAEHGKAIQQFLIWINGFEDKVSKRMQESQAAFSRKIDDNQLGILEKLQEMKKELLGTPTSNASVEKRILNKLEATMIESTNAIRIMQTNQDRIKLLEKKIESLTTQLTKYEIK